MTKVFDLQKEAEKRKELSDWYDQIPMSSLKYSTYDFFHRRERAHAQLLTHQVENDLVAWEDGLQAILVDYPKDMYALHTLFFTHLTTARRRGLRDCAYRVLPHYAKGDRYYA